MAEAARTDPTADFKPHLFGKFYLLHRLAVGGMAEIYRARVPGAGGFEKELVVKRILPARAQDRGFINMLVNEAKLTVQLTHNNIAQIYECGIIDGNYFISMELVNGVSMKEVMYAFSRAGQQLTPEQSIYLVLQLLQGLDYAHKKTDGTGTPLQIVHCDVSPDNALVSWEGEVKLLDFGIARAATGLSNYKEGMLMGKLGYVAPEQASVETRWDHRVDIFAAGILLYELLTKTKAFPKATDVESLVASRKAKVIPPTKIDPRLPKELDAIVAKALAYDPAKRYADAKTFADALVDVLFPTPHSAIQDLLGKQMQAVFADRMAKGRAARAHDPLVMKVLANVAAQQGSAEYDSLTGFYSPAPSEAPPTPSSSTPARPSRPAKPRTVIRDGVRVSTAVFLGLLVAAAGAVGLHFGEAWLRPGVLVVTSDPTGADVTLDGVPTGAKTPAVIEGVFLNRPHELQLAAAGRRDATMAVAPVPGKLVLQAHAALPSALGTLTVESTPPGAVVSIDDRRVGTTPATIREVDLGVRHRIDLALPGHEIDQFVVLPETDGTRFARLLTPDTRRPASGRSERR